MRIKGRVYLLVCLFLEARFDKLILGEAQLIKNLQIGLAHLLINQALSLLGLIFPFASPDADTHNLAMKIQIHYFLLVDNLKTHSFLAFVPVAFRGKVVAVLLNYGKIFE